MTDTKDILIGGIDLLAALIPLVKYFLLRENTTTLKKKKKKKKKRKRKKGSN